MSRVAKIEQQPVATGTTLVVMVGLGVTFLLFMAFLNEMCIRDSSLAAAWPANINTRKQASAINLCGNQGFAAADLALNVLDRNDLNASPILPPSMSARDLHVHASCLSSTGG